MRALRFAGAAALASALLAVSSFGGCGGNAFQTAGGGGDGSAGDGTQGESGSSSGGGDDGAPSEAGDGPTMTPGHTVYVAPTGHDSNSGMDPQHPVRTIKKGLDVAQGLVDAGVSVPNVLVCSGGYPEDSLHVTFDVGLYGSYDCTTNPSTWTRQPGYGWPTFDQKVGSVVTFANTTAQQATLAIYGNVTSKTTVDGLAIAGANSTASSPAPSLGLEVGDGVSPVLSNLTVYGGAGTAGATDAGSVGVRLGKGTAELKLSLIDGGAGKGPGGTGFGSIGIRVEAGTPNVHDDIVIGGIGTGGNFSSVGVDLQASLSAATGNPLSKVFVVATDSTANPTSATAGVLVEKGSTANLDLVDSYVDGAGSTSGNQQAAAVEVDSGGMATLTADRLAAGSQGQGNLYGVLATAAASFSVVNSEIHGGDVPDSGNGSTRGVYLGSAVSKANIVFDTIYTGAEGGQNGSVAIGIQSGAANVTIENDLFFGNDTGGGTNPAGSAVAAATCTGAGKQIVALDHDGFVNFSDLLFCNDVGQPNPLPAGITLTLDGGTACKATCGNVLVDTTCTMGRSDCEIDQSCPTQPPDACVQSVLGSSWPSANDGLGNQGADAGATTTAWQIQPPGNYCKLAQGGTPNPAIPDDLLGNKRSTTKPTMGAVEYGGPACIP